MENLENSFYKIFNNIDLEKPQKYTDYNLGKRTEVTPKIEKLVSVIHEYYGNTLSDPEKLDIALKFIGKSIYLLPADERQNHKKKFTRSAEQILEDGFRTGCCDGSTLFTAMSRALNIPAFQVITFNKDDVCGSKGHYFTACYFDNKWNLINSDVRESLFNGSVRYSVRDLNINSIDVHDKFYAWAFVDDYSNIETVINGNKYRIDSIKSMNKIQEKYIDEILGRNEIEY